jgi:hypothetical protein
MRHDWQYGKSSLGSLPRAHRDTGFRPVVIREFRLDNRLLVEASVALLTIFLISSRQFVGQGITLGHLASLLLLPVWLPCSRRYIGQVPLLIFGTLATAMGLWLTLASRANHEVTNTNLIANSLLLIGSIAAVGVILWAREHVPLWLIGATYGFGMLVSAFTRADSFSVNPWKFALAVPLAIIATSLAHRTRKRWLEIVTLLALALTSVAFDSRSYFGVFLVASALVAWQVLPRTAGSRVSTVRVLLIFALVAVGVYTLGTSLLLEGYLGQDAQQRSVEQQNRAGSVILGGRPELAATIALFVFRPLGFGAGTLASNTDVRVAKEGMHAIRYDPENGYVENFMFGTKFELHSMFGDLWAYFGPLGLIAACVTLIILFHALGRGVATRTIAAPALFAIIISFWNFFFNPLYSSAPVLALALGLGMIPRAGPLTSPGKGPPA